MSEEIKEQLALALDIPGWQINDIVWDVEAEKLIECFKSLQQENERLENAMLLNGNSEAYIRRVKKSDVTIQNEVKEHIHAQEVRQLESQLDKKMEEATNETKEFALFILGIVNEVTPQKKWSKKKMMTKEIAVELIDDLWNHFKYDIPVPQISKYQDKDSV